MPQTISHYRIEAELGRGGMGVVYRATDLRLERTVAIKMLRPEAVAVAEASSSAASPRGSSSGDRLERFVREARAASALNHPNIVTIYDIDREGDATFIAMELVEGTPLDRLIAKGPLPVATALDCAAQVAGALAAAHAHGIVHRDIKPANIIVGPDGRAKVLDFGLAKLVESAESQETQTAFGTREGVIVGTVAYMSPEQAEGRPVDARSDVFALGAVLYEMLTGRRPFVGSSSIGVLTAILRDEPPPLQSVRRDAPPMVAAILERALAKDPAARYADAGMFRAALLAAHARLARPAPVSAWTRPAVLVPVTIALLAAVAVLAWRTVEGRRAQRLRETLLPAVEQAEDEERPLRAYLLVKEAERLAPDAAASVRRRWLPLAADTQPAGAQVELREYLDPNGPWVPVGTTPIRDTVVPFMYYRVRITKPGYLPLEFASGPGRPGTVLALTPLAEAETGMVKVAGGRYSYGVTNAVVLPDFWIDRHEVTNEAFKRFVDAGGYRDPRYWKEPFRDGDSEVPFEDALARFRDTTGRSGPAGWELGSYPAGQEKLPVGGISWYEAAAYATFMGRRLPTLYHWYRASGADAVFSFVLRRSNFEGKGPVPAGSLEGIGPWGTTDMAGNVKEWCSTLAAGTGRRYILGGSWNEQSYRFTEADAQDPWQRSANFGVRLVKDLGPVGEDARAPIARVTGDPASVVPAPASAFPALRRFYEYDRTPLNARVDAVDTRVPEWRMETVSFDAAYGGERVPAYLFLPSNAKPPYQTVVLFPSAYATLAPSSRRLDTRMFEFLVRSGRALLYPVYKGTYERRVPAPQGFNAIRDLYVQRAKDFFRAVDYLETRPEIDRTRLAYYSLSMGAYFGPIPVALEPRLKVAVLAAGGLRYDYPPEIQPANFAARVTVPVLLINGRDDFETPLAAQRRWLEIFGTPADKKRLASLEGGHVPTDMRGLVRETLDWLDAHLGPVR